MLFVLMDGTYDATYRSSVSCPETVLRRLRSHLTGELPAGVPAIADPTAAEFQTDWPANFSFARHAARGEFVYRRNTRMNILASA
jgi:hypothetical protein